VAGLLGWLIKNGHTEGMDSAPAVALKILQESRNQEPFCRTINEEAVKQGQVRDGKTGLCILMNCGVLMCVNPTTQHQHNNPQRLLEKGTARAAASELIEAMLAKVRCVCVCSCSNHPLPYPVCVHLDRTDRLGVA
jgi:hypothetical protein